MVGSFRVSRCFTPCFSRARWWAVPSAAGVRGRGRGGAGADPAPPREPGQHRPRGGAGGGGAPAPPRPVCSPHAPRASREVAVPRVRRGPMGAAPLFLWRAFLGSVVFVFSSTPFLVLWTRGSWLNAGVWGPASVVHGPSAHGMRARPRGRWRMAVFYRENGARKKIFRLAASFWVA